MSYPGAAWTHANINMRRRQQEANAYRVPRQGFFGNSRQVAQPHLMQQPYSMQQQAQQSSQNSTLWCGICDAREINCTFQPCTCKLYCDQCWGVNISLDRCPVDGREITSVDMDTAKKKTKAPGISIEQRDERIQQAMDKEKEWKQKAQQKPAMAISQSSSNIDKIRNMSGSWTGSSRPTDLSKPPTEWIGTIVNFDVDPASPGILTISGRGSSLFQGEQIHFHLTGTVDSRTLAFELFKTHTGRFTHTLVYRGQLDLATHTLSGSFAQGSVELKHVGLDLSQWGPSYGFRNRSNDPAYGSMPAAEQNDEPTPSDIYIALDFDLTLTDSHSGGFAMTHYNTILPDGRRQFDMSDAEKKMFRDKITEWTDIGYHIIILTRNVYSQITEYFNTIFSDIRSHFMILAPVESEYAASGDANFWAEWKRSTLQLYLKGRSNTKVVFIDDTKVNVDVMQSLPNVVSYHKPAGISYMQTYKLVQDFLDDPNGELRKKHASHGGRSKKYRRTRHKKRGSIELKKVAHDPNQPGSRGGSRKTRQRSCRNLKTCKTRRTRRTRRKHRR